MRTHEAMYWLASSTSESGRWSEIARGLRSYFDEQNELAASAGMVLLGIAVVIGNVLIARRLIRHLTRAPSNK